MANLGMNSAFAKCFILFMAIVILLEGCLYMGLALWGISQEKCSEQTTDIAANPFGFAMDLIYFISEECGNPSVSTLAGTNPYEIQINWATSFAITNRMYIFMITYAVVSGLWIVSSLMVIASICGAITKLVVGISFWPWFMLVIAGSVLDVVATGFFGNDIVHTKSAYDTFQYVGVIDSQSLLDYLKNFDAYFMTPAVVMTCISSRVVLIWLLNIFGVSFCLSLSNVLAHKDPPNQPVAVTVTNTTNMLSKEISESSQPQQYQAQTSQVQTVEQYPVQIQPKPLPIQTPTTVVERQSSAHYPQTPDRRSQPPLGAYATSVAPLTDEYQSNAHANELSRQTSVAAEPGAITYRSTETHPDRLDYPVAQAATSAVDLRGATSPELSIVSPLNTRYSSADASVHHSADQSQRVSDELRSQLPWSYTSMLTKPQPPRKPHVQIYPQIPEPDYANDARPPTPAKPTSANAADNSQQSYSRW